VAVTVAAESAGVPIREGVYGDRVGAVEPGGIELISGRERHGRPFDLFWTWTSPNLEFATVFVGVIPVAFFGGGFWPTALALVVGIGLGSLTHGVLSSWGRSSGCRRWCRRAAPSALSGTSCPRA
jgi:purine-cytosine permease-like protein